MVPVVVLGAPIVPAPASFIPKAMVPPGGPTEPQPASPVSAATASALMNSSSIFMPRRRDHRMAGGFEGGSRGSMAGGCRMLEGAAWLATLREQPSRIARFRGGC